MNEIATRYCKVVRNNPSASERSSHATESRRTRVFPIVHPMCDTPNSFEADSYAKL